MITEQARKSALAIFGPQIGQKIINIANGPRSAARTKATPGAKFINLRLGGKAPTGVKSGMTAFFGERKTPPGANMLFDPSFLKGKFHR